MIPKKDVTIYDLVLKLNISPARVSRGLKDHPAINKVTKKRIMDLAHLSDKFLMSDTANQKETA